MRCNTKLHHKDFLLLLRRGLPRIEQSRLRYERLLLYDNDGAGGLKSQLVLIIISAEIFAEINNKLRTMLPSFAGLIRLIVSLPPLQQSFNLICA